MSGAESTYGINKRFAFVAQAIEAARPASVLDIGCGAGTYLTLPLAARFPDVRFVGVDADAHSIAFAQTRHRLSNLSFCLPDGLAGETRFDLVIASEVIEHVEDPLGLLTGVTRRLNPGGRLVLTLPNGYGPFEIMALVETLLDAIGIAKLLRRVLGGRRASAGELPDTLAASPHINFFGFGQIKALIAGAGFRVLAYQPRTFLCGWGIDRLLRGERLIEWNARVSESLPACLSSDWMFVLEQAEPLAYRGYRRGAYARVRRFLNERRPGLGGPPG